MWRHLVLSTVLYSPSPIANITLTAHKQIHMRHNHAHTRIHLLGVHTIHACTHPTSHSHFVSDKFIHFVECEKASHSRQTQQANTDIESRILSVKKQAKQQEHTLLFFFLLSLSNTIQLFHPMRIRTNHAGTVCHKRFGKLEQPNKRKVIVIRFICFCVR